MSRYKVSNLVNHFVIQSPMQVYFLYKILNQETVAEAVDLTHSPPGGFTYVDLHLICSTKKVCYFCDKENEKQSSIITQLIIRKM